MIETLRDATAARCRVLIVEDDALLQSILVEIFTDLGAQCEAFLTADDALIHLLQSQVTYNLIVTDYTLPGQLNGGDFVLMVRQRWTSVPVIMTTGLAVELGSVLPANVAFLQKPWSIEQIVATARQLLSGDIARI
ncbi:response regulator [Pseudomonas cremoricolorata]|uniref:response regulator n=1 Tax=Pseudomonas cremoricolorata TaxID=157783 RepID=UPI0003FDFDEB|nr:response regulator [Pseudomonas cremoricolorata]